MEDGTPPHNDQSQMLNLEIHSGKKMFNLIKPFAGFYILQKIHITLMGDLELMDIMEKKNWVLTPALACGYYNSGHEIKAGNPLEFYIGIDLFYRFENNARLGLVFSIYLMQIVV